jgi:hypothetical protein
MAAYEEALTCCSTKYAPWYIIPANRKWYRNLAISEALVETLRPHREEWQRALDAMSQARLAELKTFRYKQTASATRP